MWSSAQIEQPIAAAMTPVASPERPGAGVPYAWPPRILHGLRGTFVRAGL
jgi:hypothetical protein